MTYSEVASQVKRLPLPERLMLLETLTRSVREELKSSAAWPHSAAGKDLQHLAGAISPEDAGQMCEAIEQGCEQVTARLHFGPPRRML
jgi:hypothetical protein